MSENYIVINGKRAKLTEEQLKTLGLEKEDGYINRYQADREKVLPFTISAEGDVLRACIEYDKKYNNYNLYSDEKFAKQTANRQLLERMLREFSYKHGWRDEYYADYNKVYYIICYWKMDNNFSAVWDCRVSFGQPCFISKEAAEQAIEEVIKPFMKEHPDFIWGM